MLCLLHIAPSFTLRFLLLFSHATIILTGENETRLPCLFSFSSSSFFYPFLIRLGAYLSFLFFPLFSTSIAGILLVCICKKKKKTEEESVQRWRGRRRQQQQRFSFSACRHLFHSTVVIS
jgi:hypothetical protein